MKRRMRMKVIQVIRVMCGRKWMQALWPNNRNSNKELSWHRTLTSISTSKIYTYNKMLKKRIKGKMKVLFGLRFLGVWEPTRRKTDQKLKNKCSNSRRFNSPTNLRNCRCWKISGAISPPKSTFALVNIGMKLGSRAETLPLISGELAFFLWFTGGVSSKSISNMQFHFVNFVNSMIFLWLSRTSKLPICYAIWSEKRKCPAGNGRNCRNAIMHWLFTLLSMWEKMGKTWMSWVNSSKKLFSGRKET